MRLKTILLNCISAIFILLLVQSAWAGSGLSAFDAPETLKGLAPTLMPISGNKIGLDFAFAHRGVDASGYSLTTYGVRAVSNLNEKSSIRSTVFFSNPYESSPRDRIIAMLDNKQLQQQSKETLTGRLMIHEGSFGKDKLKLSFAYQDISSGFSGFQSMREAKYAPEEIINQLEKEKGIRRLDVGLAMATGTNSQVSLGVSQVQDGEGAIQSASAAYESLKLKANFSTRRIDEDFKRFSGIREQNRDQLAREKGMNRTSFSLAFASKLDLPEDKWNRFQMLSLGDKTGSFNVRTLSFSMGKASFSYDSYGADSSFKRMADLSPEDKTNYALAIHRQFNPNADIKQITDADRAEIAKMAGIDRTSLRLSFETGKDSNLALQSFSINDGAGSIDRRLITFNSKNAHFYYMSQEIDKSFSGMRIFAAIERSNFGNEVGMNRVNFGGGFKSGDITAQFASSQVDDGKASITRRSVSLAGKSFNIRANFTNIDPNFTRISDLSDPDRAALEMDRGFHKTDISGSFKIGNQITLDAFYMTASNPTAKIDRNQLRTNLVYTAKNDMKFVWFRDVYEVTRQQGFNPSYSRQFFSIQRRFNALGFLSFSQDVCEKKLIDGSDVCAVVQTRHYDNGKNGRLNIAYDYKGQDFGDGRFDNLTDYVVEYKASKNLSVKTSFHEVDRGNEPSETVRTNSIQWELKKELNFSADIIDRETNNNNDGNITRLSLSGPIADRFGPLSNVKLSALYYSENKNGQAIKGNEAIKIEATLLKGYFTAEYAGVTTTPHSSLATTGFSFVSDRDEKKPIHFNVAYKTREIAPGKQVLIRAYGIDAKINKNTSLTYVLESNKERPDGILDPVGLEELKIKSKLGKQIDFIGGFKKQQDYARHLGSYLMDVGLSGKMNNGATFELGFGINRSMNIGEEYSGNTFRIKYDHKVNENHYLLLQAQFTKWQGKITPGHFGDDVLIRIDFKRVFDL